MEKRSNLSESIASILNVSHKSKNNVSQSHRAGKPMSEFVKVNTLTNQPLVETELDTENVETQNARD